jgi:hypothetical protein
MTLLEPGTVLKRKFADFQEVKVIESNEKHTAVQDSSGVHYVPTSAISTHFTIVDNKTKG